MRPTTFSLSLHHHPSFFSLFIHQHCFAIVVSRLRTASALRWLRVVSVLISQHQSPRFAACSCALGRKPSRSSKSVVTRPLELACGLLLRAVYFLQSKRVPTLLQHSLNLGLSVDSSGLAAASPFLSRQNRLSFSRVFHSLVVAFLSWEA